MRLQLRETGSILVKARKDEVLEILQRHVLDGHLVGDRVESRGSTYVVREEADGTHVFHARSESSPVMAAQREREELRRAVKADLFELQQAFDVQSR